MEEALPLLLKMLQVFVITRYNLLSIPTKTKPHNGSGNTLQGPTACSIAVWFDSLLLPKREPPSIYV